MDYRNIGGDIHLKQADFDLDETLDCGQAFRWERVADGYHGFLLNKSLTITRHSDSIVLHDTTEADFLNIWADYFDLQTDYGELKRQFSQDETLSKACKFAGGIRLLRQDSWEALCSFIISQNNNIPRIKGIIARMCALFDGFPTAEQLSSATLEEISPLRAGFRNKYLLDAAGKVATGEVDLEQLKTAGMSDARTNLMKISGVGPKVAECALLYGMYRVEAFPVDVWIKRVLAEFYPNGFPAEFAENAGVAQQYLFHYVRNLATEKPPKKV